MISESNAKLGKIPNWSLPPKVTCPGSTPECREACYVGGKTGYYKMYPSVRKAYGDNLRSVTLDNLWTIDAIKALAKNPKYFRIHVSGDFHKVDYINKWVNICKAFPKTQFLAFTRSWRVKRLVKALETLKSLPNVQIIASLDKSTEREAPNGYRLASMGKPTISARFVMCPGYGPKELKCDECGICFRNNSTNVWFPIH